MQNASVSSYQKKNDAFCHKTVRERISVASEQYRYECLMVTEGINRRMPTRGLTVRHEHRCH